MSSWTSGRATTSKRCGCTLLRRRTRTSRVSRTQTRAQATTHYKSKVDYLGTNLEALQETIQKKQDNMNLLVNIMQSKLQAEASK